MISRCMKTTPRFPDVGNLGPQPRWAFKMPVISYKWSEITPIGWVKLKFQSSENPFIYKIIGPPHFTPACRDGCLDSIGNSHFLPHEEKKHMTLGCQVDVADHHCQNIPLELTASLPLKIDPNCPQKERIVFQASIWSKCKFQGV